ncbi:MAG: hypothetical protein ACYDHY_01240 [Acidiferrobacterales bacterium]
MGHQAAWKARWANDPCPEQGNHREGIDKEDVPNQRLEGGAADGTIDHEIDAAQKHIFMCTATSINRARTYSFTFSY